MALLGTIAASSEGSITVKYLPQFIGFTATTVPTKLQIEVAGLNMTFNLDGAGLGAMTHIRANNRASNTYLFQLANGLLNGYNTTITLANAVAAPLNVFGWSPVKKGNTVFKYERLSMLVSQNDISDFAYLGFPSAAAGDRFQIAYNDGSVDTNGRDEVNIQLAYTQGDIASKYNIDNINPVRVRAVAFTPIAAQTAYMMSYAAVR